MVATIPKRVFIIPYRDRKEQMYFFQKYSSLILDDILKDSEIYFSHQYDNRPFNRGGMKNIGFLAIKSKYPNDYQDINFIFNDVDCISYKKLFPYETTQGVVAHYYGSIHTLGGIVVIKGSDFEKINGFPNFWSWSSEDNVLQERCIHYNLIIDRTNFYEIGSPEVLQLFDGMKRLLSKNDCSRPPNTFVEDGLSTITKLYFTIDKSSKNQNDIGFLDEKENTFVINVFRFTTLTNYKTDNYSLYDIREPVNKFMKQSYNNHITTDLTNLDWKSFEMPKTSPLTVSALKQIPDIRPTTTPSINNYQQSLRVKYEKPNNITNQINNRVNYILEQRIANISHPFNNRPQTSQVRYEKNNNTQQRNNRATHIIEQRVANRIKPTKIVKQKGNLIFTH